jgi:hypothetical protein
MGKIAKEVAEKEFEKLCANRRIVSDLTELDDLEKSIFLSRKAKLVRLMMNGSLVLQEKGELVYTPVTDGVTPITFHRATAAVLMEGDSAKGSVERLLLMATALTKSEDGRLAKLEIPDFRAVDEITAFLIAR